MKWLPKFNRDQERHQIFMSAWGIAVPSLVLCFVGGVLSVWPVAAGGLIGCAIAGVMVGWAWPPKKTTEGRES